MFNFNIFIRRFCKFLCNLNYKLQFILNNLIKYQENQLLNKKIKKREKNCEIIETNAKKTTILNLNLNFIMRDFQSVDKRYMCFFPFSKTQLQFCLFNFFFFFFWEFHVCMECCLYMCMHALLFKHDNFDVIFLW